MNFELLIRRLRFNLESAKSARALTKYDQPEDSEVLESYIQNIEGSIRKLEIAKEVAEQETLSEEDVRRVMSITCYRDIGYCCGLAKACMWRDCCRDALGIDDETYAAIKEAVVWHMLERTNRAENMTARGEVRAQN